MAETVARIINQGKNTDIVTFSILVEGEDISLGLGIKSITICKEINKIPYAKIRLDDGDPAQEDFEVSNRDILEPGKNIEIEFGYRSENISLFKGIITNHRNSILPKKSELQIECRDKAFLMTLDRKFKHYNDLSDSEIAEEILNHYGLETEVESTRVTHKNLVQYDTSDWDFIISRMDVNGQICIIDGGVVTFKKPDLSGDSALDVLFGATIVEYQAEIDARIQLQKLKSVSWDYSNQEVKEVEASEPSFGQSAGSLSTSQLADISGSEYKLIHSGKLTEEELQAWADSKLQKHRLAKIRGKVKFEGYPEILPGQYISLNGVGEKFTGPVFVNSVKQEYEDGQWFTEVGFGLNPEWFAETINPYHPSAAKGLLPSVQGLLTGKVTDLEDPEGENRIRVCVPVIDENATGIWARVVSLDAGEERGMFFRPEIGDEVLVGFIQNDPTQVVVLGMLNSSAKPAPFEASNDNHEKGYVTREDMKLVFNDDEKSIKIETPAGKKVIINEKDNLISLEDENGNKILMESSGIKMEASGSIEIKAGSEVKIEGATVSVNGSGSTEIKGGVVKIN